MLEDLLREVLDVFLDYIDKERMHALIDEADEIRAARVAADAEAEKKFGAKP